MEPKKKPKKVEFKWRTCLYCDGQFQNDKEFMEHIKQKHSQYYQPRKRKEEAPVSPFDIK